MTVLAVAEGPLVFGFGVFVFLALAALIIGGLAYAIRHRDATLRSAYQLGLARQPTPAPVPWPYFFPPGNDARLAWSFRGVWRGRPVQIAEHRDSPRPLTAGAGHTRAATIVVTPLGGPVADQDLGVKAGLHWRVYAGLLAGTRRYPIMPKAIRSELDALVWMADKLGPPPYPPRVW
ncbi:hypothetical protein [Actinocatenispora comari]|uniref:DUF2550 family protein n=1 Tax=Actinocatenispora comari TaxID=2807577 RepID=A0A8J4AII9_9ACTN|nr:hypothetical protein [Actinocatenispora comari]GIL29202.1 hypothetical protein NUM_44560 [Actinocatenispora comari]GIL31843.1 hypothetical protein NUM_70970 [Actinocatenispora comari]